MCIQNVAGQDQECDAEAYATLKESFLAVQLFLECTFGLPEDYTFGNAKEYAALAAISSYNQSGYDAMDQSDCSALCVRYLHIYFLRLSGFFSNVSRSVHRNESLLGIARASVYFGFTLANDSSSKSGVYDAFLECVFPNETCDIVYLTLALTLNQYGIGCYLTLANGSYQLSDDLEEILYVLDALNKTASYAAIANQCDTL